MDTLPAGQDPWAFKAAVGPNGADVIYDPVGGDVFDRSTRAIAFGGRLLVVDFAPHQEESLRSHHAHRRLGFQQAEVEGYLTEAGLNAEACQILRPEPGETAKLAVSLWIGADPRLVGDFPLPSPTSQSHREVA